MADGLVRMVAFHNAPSPVRLTGREIEFKAMIHWLVHRLFISISSTMKVQIIGLNGMVPLSFQVPAGHHPESSFPRGYHIAYENAGEFDASRFWDKTVPFCHCGCIGPVTDLPPVYVGFHFLLKGVEMSKSWSRLSSWVGFLTILVTLMSSSVTRAEMVLSGYDLFHTDPGGTSFDGKPFQGVPIGQFDFGDGKGPVNTYQTDTIVHRLDDVTDPSGDTRIQLVALQLRSVNQVSIMGGPFGYYYVTLQSRRTLADLPLLPEPLTTGEGIMTINFENPGVGGTFTTSSYDVFFDLRFGSLTGPIVFSGSQSLDGGGNWTHEPPPNTLLIDGVNSRLNGTNHDADFFPSTIHTGPHGVGPASAPEPTSLMLAGLGSLFVLGYRGRKGRK